MKVIFFPYDENNPYQAQLKRGLESFGVEVEEGSRRPWFPLRQVGIFGNGLEVVHLHWLDSLILARTWLATFIKASMLLVHLCLLRLGGVTIVWTAHNLHPHEQKFTRLERFLRQCVARVCTTVFVHCDFARLAVRKHLNLGTNRRIVVIPHGHYAGWYPNKMNSQEARESLDIPKGLLVFLFFGNIREYKGVPELIKAFKALALPNTFLLIAGAPRLEELEIELRQEIAKVPNACFHPGFVEDGDVQRYMKAADVAVFPYRDALTSGAIVLAMSFGLACVAARSGCIAEILQEQRQLLFDPADRDGLSLALSRAATIGGELSSIGEVNRKKAMSWDWRNIAQMTLNGYAR